MDHLLPNTLTSLALRRRIAVAVLVMGLAPVTVQGEQDVIQEETEDFLSDRGRVGAVTGSILAGAALSNPFAPLVGNIVGFLVGKHSDSSRQSEKQAAQLAGGGSQGSRSIIPNAGSTIGTLSLSGGASGGEAVVGEGAGVQVFTGSLSQSGVITSVPIPSDGTANASTDTGPVIAGPVLASAGQAGGASSSAPAGSATPSPAPLPAASSPVPSSPTTAAVVPPAAQQEAPISYYSPPQTPLPPAPAARQPGVSAGVAASPVAPGMASQAERDQARVRALREELQMLASEPEFVANEQCPQGQAPRYQKKVAVTAFGVERPQDASLGGVFNVGQQVPATLYQHMLNSQKVQVLSHVQETLYASLADGPSWQHSDNRIFKSSPIAQEMGAQFVVSGVIRALGMEDSAAWDTSVAAQLRRSMGRANQNRQFVVDVIVHDGFTGHPILEQRYQARDVWTLPLEQQVGFGSTEFNRTPYGQAVGALLARIASEVVEQLDCQPLMVRILSTDKRNLELDAGSLAGLASGVRMRVLRTQSVSGPYGAVTKLTDTGLDVTVRQVTLNRSYGLLPMHAEQRNIQAGDLAVIW